MSFLKQLDQEQLREAINYLTVNEQTKTITYLFGIGCQYSTSSHRVTDYPRILEENGIARFSSQKETKGTWSKLLEIKLDCIKKFDEVLKIIKKNKT